MHASSLNTMTKFVTTLSGEGSVLDIGSRDINGSYRFLFEGWDYTGLDIVAGPNVDYVPDDPYAWTELKDDSFDVVISGQAIEHIEFPEKTFVEIARVLKPGGVICIIGPTVGGSHSEPWYRDVTMEYMSKLTKGVDFEIKNLAITNEPVWYDCVLIAEKPKEKKASGKRQS